jgi:preprotein translocase subunit Sec63
VCSCNPLCVDGLCDSLPTWLLEKSNEHLILAGYFLLIFLLPSILIFWWWRGAKQYHESGTMKDTVAWYFNFLPDTVSVKYLIELLAASAEYRALEKTPTDALLFRKLVNEVKDVLVKQKFPHPYIFKGVCCCVVMWLCCSVLFVIWRSFA